jgi:hypothetical protein
VAGPAARRAVGDLRAPVLATLTIIGMIVNRVRPEAMQRARLDLIDKPLWVIPALPGTNVTPVALPHCPAEWVVTPEPRDPSGSSFIFTALRW